MEAAGRFGSLSDGHFPLSHWAALILPPNRSIIAQLAAPGAENYDISRPFSAGFLIELRAGGGTPIIDSATNYTLPETWSSRLAGLTNFPLDVITSEGSCHYVVKCEDLSAASQVLRDHHTDYHWYTNNCQNFVLYLIRRICQFLVSGLPQTIRDATTPGFG